MTCIIVRQGAFQNYEHLQAAFGHWVPVILDRRRNGPLDHADTAPSASIPNRRRKPPPSWTALGFVVVDRPVAWTQAALSADLGMLSLTVDLGLPA